MRKYNSVTYEVGKAKAEQASGMFGLTADQRSDSCPSRVAKPLAKPLPGSWRSATYARSQSSAPCFSRSMRDSSLAALLVGFVSITPALAMMKEMDRRGQTMNAAFSVCAASALAAHLGFTMSVEPQMLMPLLLTKLLGGMLAAILAVAFTKRKNAPFCEQCAVNRS